MLAPFYGAMTRCIFWRTGIDHGPKYKKGQRLRTNFTLFTTEISRYVIAVAHTLALTVLVILTLPQTLRT